MIVSKQTKKPKPKPKTKKGGSNVLLSTLANLPSNYTIISPGIITGRSIRSMGIVNSLLSGLSSIVGSKQNWTGIEEILDNVREEALREMIERSTQYNPDAIFGINIELSEISSGKSNALLVCTVSGTMCKHI